MYCLFQGFIKTNKHGQGLTPVSIKVFYKLLKNVIYVVYKNTYVYEVYRTSIFLPTLLQKTKLKHPNLI